MKTKQSWIWAAPLIIAGTAACSGPAPQAPTGKIKRESIAVTTKVPGRVADLLVGEGDLVAKGDTLAILDIPEVDAKIDQAQGAVRSATAQYEMAQRGATANQLRQLRAKHDALKEQFEFAQKSFNRVQAMFADSLVSPQSFDEASAKFQGARAQYDAVVAELAEAEAGVRQENKLMALGQKERADGALREAETASNERYIIAPADMTIETITLHVGELATPGYALFNGYLPGTTWFRFTLPEDEIGTLQRGTAVTVQLPYLGESLKGKVANIKQLANYADVTTAYPDYELEQALYEIKVVPASADSAERLLNNATVVLQ